jgi:hypothetical protein
LQGGNADWRQLHKGDSSIDLGLCSNRRVFLAGYNTGEQENEADYKERGGGLQWDICGVFLNVVVGTGQGKLARVS